MIINFSTGTIGVPVAKRIDYLRACRPEVAALNMGSMNYAKYSRIEKGLRVQDGLRQPVRGDHRAAGGDERAGDQAGARVLRHRPRRRLAPLIDMGVLKTPLHVDFVMGVVGGSRRPRATWRRWSKHPARGSHWGVIGISRDQWMLVGAALSLGGSIRVGLEDNLYLPDGSMAAPTAS